MIGIYKITNQITGEVYIGQSIRIKQRWREHCINSVNGTTQLYQAMRNYGLKNFSFDVIEECDKEKLNEREIYWISYYDSFNKGYNMTPGGSEPSKANPQEIYDLWDQGLCVSEIYEKLKDKVGHTTIQNYLQEYPNYSPTESNRRGGIRARKIAIENGSILANNMNKGIKQYDLWGNFIREWKTQNEIERELKIDSDLIGRVLNGRQQQAGGYQWIIGDQQPENLTKKKGFQLKFGIIQYDLNGNEIKRYPTLIQAAMAMNCDSKNISCVCKHQRNRVTACGYKWEYDYSIWNGKPI